MAAKCVCGVQVGVVIVWMVGGVGALVEVVSCGMIWYGIVWYASGMIEVVIRWLTVD